MNEIDSYDIGRMTDAIKDVAHELKLLRKTAMVVSKALLEAKTEDLSKEIKKGKYIEKHPSYDWSQEDLEKVAKYMEKEKAC